LFDFRQDCIPTSWRQKGKCDQQRRHNSNIQQHSKRLLFGFVAKGFLGNLAPETAPDEVEEP